MLSRQNIYGRIKPADGKARHLSTFQNAKEISNALKMAEYNSRGVSKQLVKYFKEPTDYATAAKVWHFLRTQIKYRAEPKTDQTAKEIQRFIQDGTGDCKHFATFAVGVLNACGIKTWFTFVGQDASIKKPNHVYGTALIDGQLVCIDPCRKRFDSEPRYFYKWDIPRITNKNK